MRHALALAAAFGQSCATCGFEGGNGDAAAVTRMLDRGADPDARDEHGLPPCSKPKGKVAARAPACRGSGASEPREPARMLRPAR